VASLCFARRLVQRKVSGPVDELERGRCGEAMREVRLMDSYELWVAAELSEAVIAELWHVAPHGNRLRNYTPVGLLAAAPRPGGAEELPHWQADLYIRSDLSADLRDTRLPATVVDWLLAETGCTEPLLLNIHESDNTDFVLRGRILEDPQE